jgi:hypothetical protein
MLKCPKNIWKSWDGHYPFCHDPNRGLVTKVKTWKEMQVRKVSQDSNRLPNVATPLWGKCEDETHTPKSGNLESSRTPENVELDCRGQNTWHWGVLYTVGKVLKCRCPKWPCMSHLDICSTSYGRKKGQESN